MEEGRMSAMHTPPHPRVQEIACLVQGALRRVTLAPIVWNCKHEGSDCMLEFMVIVGFEQARLVTTIKRRALEDSTSDRWAYLKYAIVRQILEKLLDPALVVPVPEGEVIWVPPL